MVYLSCQPSDATHERVDLLEAILMTHIQGPIYGVFLDFVIIYNINTSPMFSGIFLDVTKAPTCRF
jgi:hypothetical protein